MKKTIKLSFYYSQMIFLIFLPIWMKLTNYLYPIVLGVVWFAIVLLVLFGVCWVRKDRIRLPIHLLHVITILYSFGLLTLLFFRPEDQSYNTINLIPFDTIYFYFSNRVHFLIAFYNLVGNIFLFVPFGVYYQYVKSGPSLKQLLIIAIFSIGIIEGLQFITKRGRLDIDDLILNVLGVCIGSLIYPFLNKILDFK